MVTQGRRVLRGMRAQPLQAFVNPSLAAMVVRAAQPETVVLLAIREAQETQEILVIAVQVGRAVFILQP